LDGCNTSTSLPSNCYTGELLDFDGSLYEICAVCQYGYSAALSSCVANEFLNCLIQSKINGEHNCLQCLNDRVPAQDYLSCVKATNPVPNCRTHERVRATGEERCGICDHGYYLKDSDHKCYSNEVVGKQGCMVANADNQCEYCNHFNNFYAVGFDETHGTLCEKFGFNYKTRGVLMVILVALFALKF